MTEAPTFRLFTSNEDSQAFAAGTKVFTAGEPGDCMFAVQDGEVDLVVAGVVVETVTPGGVFGEMALIEREPRSATAIARSDVRLAVIDEKRFAFLTQNTPGFALNVLRLISRRLRAMDERP